ncbi:EscE/YscE/SsaE family type III secretion system needle protein co-chaperone [Shewanella woodyi]|uniref:EscE/YscE/SsaE family type III secretion system needle protein co-chaperone n=1 Tax=Shewanella woodyi TaxID=60961 RepID=UPI0037498A2C
MRASDAGKDIQDIRQSLQEALAQTKRQMNAGCKPEEYSQLTNDLAALDAANQVLDQIQSK